MRLANRKDDFWELRSVEEAHRQHPDTFWIPPLEERQNLKRGQAVKLIFDIEFDNDGDVIVASERMWVTVAERIGSYYIGILNNQPASFEPSDDIYLCFGAEIPFAPEHIADIVDSLNEYSDWQLNQKPERIWPRED